MIYPRLNNEGFLLATTLWILAALSIGTAIIAVWADQAIEEAWSTAQLFEAKAEIFSTKSVVLYLLGTQPMNHGGLILPEAEEKRDKPLTPLQLFMGKTVKATGGELPLDDTPFAGVGGSRFSIQDANGLLNLRFPDKQSLSKLLGLLGVSPDMRDPMIDKLLDYSDPDSLHRLNGAEEIHYKKQGLPPPPNRSLFISWEARKVLTWNDHILLWENGAFARFTTINSSGKPNFNTASKLVLQCMKDISADAALKIIEKRRGVPFENISDINKTIGYKLSMEPLAVNLFPGPYQRLTVWHERSPSLLEINIYLTPSTASGTPWTIESAVRMPLTDFQKKATVHNDESLYFPSSLF